MKEGQKLWTRDELILAINLYCKIPFGKMHRTNPEVIALATLIGRTPSSVAFKLGNLASFDPELQARGIKGASNASKLDEQIWDEFYNNWDEALIESEKLLAKFKYTTVEQLNEVNEDVWDYKQGLDKVRLTKTRINQVLFRKIILARYSEKCCITGISNTDLIIASHILPWSKDENNRLNPMNGLALNALHDKAFENGLVAINNNYEIVVSSKLKNSETDSIHTMFLQYEGQSISLPDKFLPSKEFLKIHLNERFKV
ncbi:MAG: HNH endonuclease [Flavobacterium sp.]|nr:MAG: HNH endonuclease [Flavobacterium sp.]